MRVLFVCTGNTFRSMCAEYCLNDYLKKTNQAGVEASSAGTIALPGGFDSVVLSELSTYGIDASRHKQTRLTKAMIEEADLVIAMADYHQKFIKDNFGRKVPLFNEVCYGRSESVWDAGDVIADTVNEVEAVNAYLRKTVGYIHDSMPSLARKLLVNR
jgi:protein-tyrosine phosphatase